MEDNSALDGWFPEVCIRAAFFLLLLTENVEHAKNNVNLIAEFKAFSDHPGTFSPGGTAEEQI